MKAVIKGIVPESQYAGLPEVIKRRMHIPLDAPFIVRDGSSWLPVQVTWRMDDTSTTDRELKGLTEACNHLGVNDGIILCFDQEEAFNHKGISVHVYPVYKYFLENRMSDIQKVDQSAEILFSIVT